MAPSIYRGLNGIWMQCNAMVLNDEGIRSSDSDAVVVNYDDEEYTETVKQCFNLMRVTTFGQYLTSRLTLVMLMDGETMYIDVPYDEFQKLFSEAMTWQLVALKNA